MNGKLHEKEKKSTIDKYFIRITVNEIKRWF